MKYLIVGLGNIGREYEDTRHNIGFMVADELSSKFEAPFELQRHSFKTEFKYKGKSIHLIKPTTFMNLSGKAVNYWMKELKINPENLLVILDDIALPFGTLRLRAKGSSAGHNGLKDIESYFGQSYNRLRFGIGDDFHKGYQADYVLSPFTSKEFDELPPHIERARDICLSWIFQGVGRTMTQYNKGK